LQPQSRTALCGVPGKGRCEEQEEFVRWWRENVKPPGPRALNSDRNLFSLDEAERATGIKQVQVSRWRKSLADKEKYRDKMMLATFRKADLAVAENHRAEGTGENEWYTPAQYLEAARRVMGE
jgi:hypothetical protein